MKERLSVTVDKDVLKQLENHLNKRIFRNKSHIVELALNKWLEEQKGEK